MFHAPITDRKNKTESSNSTTSSDRERQHQTVNSSARFSSTRDRPNSATIQQGYGNQTTLRMLESQKSTIVHPLPGELLQRKCACGNAASAAGNCTECQEKQERSLQTKLRISEPGDEYEQEADRVAEQVMLMPEPEAIADSITPLQRRSADRDRISQVPPIVNEVLNSPGQPLDANTRSFMEPRFDRDFSQVRIHADARADESSRAIGAIAYTMQNHIAFARGNYAPESARGRQLLAHELTHVVQQRAAVQQSAPLVQRQETAPDTSEATPLSTTVSSGRVEVPQGRGGQAGSVDTGTFFIPLSTTVHVSATASYIGSSTNVSDWSMELFRSPWWGADERIAGTWRNGRVGGPALTFSVSPPDTPTRSYYLRFRNASQYEPIAVTYTATL